MKLFNRSRGGTPEKTASSYDDSMCVIEGLMDYGNYSTSSPVQAQIDKVVTALRSGLSSQIDCPACNMSFDVTEERTIFPRDFGRCERPFIGSLNPSSGVLNLAESVNFQHEADLS